MAVKGTPFRLGRLINLPSNFNLGYATLGKQAKSSVQSRAIRPMSLFQRFFILLVFTFPGLVFGAAAVVRVKIGAASFSSSTLSLWIAQEQGIFTKHGIEAQTILIRGGPTLVASLMTGDINLAFTSGVSVLGAAAQGIDVKNAHLHIEPGELEIGGGAGDKKSAGFARQKFQPSEHRRQYVDVFDVGPGATRIGTEAGQHSLSPDWRPGHHGSCTGDG
jgi:hypothetical protein